jgi:hypothetical protein
MDVLLYYKLVLERGDDTHRFRLYDNRVSALGVAIKKDEVALIRLMPHEVRRGFPKRDLKMITVVNKC